MAAVIEVPSHVAPLTCEVSWEKLPDYYLLPDEPVDNTDHPLLAAALHESLELAGLLTDQYCLVATNLGVCATVNGRTVVKAPDWMYVPQVIPLDPPRVRHSYTPHLEGDVPAVVMEFLSDKDGEEYSNRSVYPHYGKFWFYECILQAPYYVIFDPEAGALEVRRLMDGIYEMQEPGAEGHYWIEHLKMFLGIWQGAKADRTGCWLRWWDADGRLLLWATERVEYEQERAERERERAERERERAERERERAERLAAWLRSQGIDPDSL